MATFPLYNTEGAKIGTVEQPSLFSVEVNQNLIHRYLLWVRSVLRDSIAHTKTRGEVSGGGRKPWRQKGTGRARVGSTRSPIWRTGGVVFGPRSNRNWATRMPRGERQKALFSTLASKAANIIVLDSWNVQTPKTKEVVSIFSKLPITADQKALYLHPSYEVPVFKAMENLAKVTPRTVSRMGITDILNHDVIVLTKETLQSLEQHFSPKL